MKGIAKKLISAVVAAAAAVMVAVTAFADYTYSFDDKVLITELTADVIEMNGTSVVLEKELGEGKSDDGITIRFALFNDYLNTEFWNTDDITVSCEVKLETEGANVIGYIPGFDTKWTWINPSEFTQLKYGEWVTISETGKHFYPTFSKSAPNQLLFQLRSNWDAGKQGVVRITLRNFTIHGTPVPLETTTEATTTKATTTTATTTTATETEPVVTDTEPVESEPVESEPVESEPVESEPEESTATEKVEEPVETTSATTVTESTTSIQTAAAATTASSIDYSALLERPENNIGLMIGIILGVAALIVAGVVVGYIIYRKKKYY